MKVIIKRYKAAIAVLAVFVIGLTFGWILHPQPAEAGFDLGDLVGKAVKVGGIKLLIDEFDDDLDNAINSVFDNNDYSTDAATKVVAIISPLGNKHIGAAQVVGPQEAVERVNAVVQLETSFKDKLFRIDVLVPVESKDGTDFARVPGVGVSAVIDVKI